MLTLFTTSRTSFLFQKTTLEDHLRQASSDIVAILKNPPSKVALEIESGDKVQNEILNLATTLNNADTIPNLLESQNTNKQVPLPRVNGPPNKSSSLPRVNSLLDITSPLPRVNKPINNTQLLDKLPKYNWQKIQTPTNRYNLRSKLYPSSFRYRATCSLLAQQIFSTPTISHIYDNSGKRQSIDRLINGSDKETWTKSLSMELGRLSQGNVHGVQSTDTIEFILQQDVPANEKVTYAQCVCNHRPLNQKIIGFKFSLGKTS